MLWKIYVIDTGVTVKAGFSSEDEAKDWLETNREGKEDLYIYEEMDEDEEAEWLEAREKGEDSDLEVDDDEDMDDERYSYTTEDDIGEDDGDPLAGFDEEDLDDD